LRLSFCIVFKKVVCAHHDQRLFLPLALAVLAVKRLHTGKVTALNVKEKGDKEKRKEETKEKTIVCLCVCGKKKKKKKKEIKQNKNLSPFEIFRGEHGTFRNPSITLD
jgi:hypothetical protein